MTGQLDGRTVLVAGATGPLGRAIAETLSSRGAAVAIHHRRSADVATEIAAALPGPSLVVAADIADEDAVDSAVSEVEASLGPVDVLVNAAHIAVPPASFVDLDPAALDSQLASVRGHALLCQRVLRPMRQRGWGRIVYVSGALMSRPAPGFAAFGAAKAAASTLTRYIALENGAAGITANIVAPGRIVDPAEPPLTPTMAALSDRLRERMALDFPDTFEVAGVVAMLLGSDADVITGQTVWATGGEPIT
jgi:NAD(P)-dependent dehydrogenase (short-subunit alcohol dehydrogenase family)